MNNLNLTEEQVNELFYENCIFKDEDEDEMLFEEHKQNLRKPKIRKNAK
jgi:hypothetical protein